MFVSGEPRLNQLGVSQYKQDRLPVNYMIRHTQRHTRTCSVTIFTTGTCTCNYILCT